MFVFTSSVAMEPSASKHYSVLILTEIPFLTTFTCMLAELWIRLHEKETHNCSFTRTKNGCQSGKKCKTILAILTLRLPVWRKFSREILYCWCINYGKAIFGHCTLMNKWLLHFRWLTARQWTVDCLAQYSR